MPLNQLPGQDAIIAQLKTIVGANVYQGQYVTDGAIPPIDAQGLFEPYITTIFGATYRGHEPGIVSERYNSMNTTVTVYCASPDDRLTRSFIDDVRDKLIGFIPTDCTELKPNGGYIYVDADLGVNRYVHAVVFSYTTNMTYVA
jgi:hypothetical protein